MKEINMIFETRRKVSSGVVIDIELPNLARERCLVPIKLTFYQRKTGETSDSPARNLHVTVKSASATIYVAGEPYFYLSNEVDLSAYLNQLSEGQDISVQLCNRSKDHVEYTVNVEYETNHGNIILQSQYDTFEAVLSDVKRSGFCTQLIITANRPLTGSQIAPIFDVILLK